MLAKRLRVVFLTSRYTQRETVSPASGGHGATHGSNAHNLLTLG